VRRGWGVKRILLVVLAALALLIFVGNWTWGRLPVTPQAKGRFVELPGLRLRYLETPGREPAVLLLHGQPGTAEDFERLTPLLAGHRTIAIDRPGYGFSTGGYFPFDRQLSALDQTLAALKVHKAILVGHSYGGTVALGYGETRPARVAGLVLMDAGASCVHVDYQERMQARLAKALELPVIAQLSTATFSQLTRKTLGEAGDDEAFSPNPVDPAHRRRLLSINLKHGNLEAYGGEALAANEVIARVNRGLPSLRLPVVVIQGDHDKLVEPRCGQGLAAAVPGAEFMSVSGGHMTPYTHPADAAAAVERVAALARVKKAG
jgi:pimeloyl-ACP methyl ester carboxylesterase